MPLRTQEPPTVQCLNAVLSGSQFGPCFVAAACNSFLNIYLWVISQYCQYLRPYSVWMVGGSGLGLIWGTITAFTWRGCVPPEIRPKHFANTCQKHYRLSQHDSVTEIFNRPVRQSRSIWKCYPGLITGPSINPKQLICPVSTSRQFLNPHSRHDLYSIRDVYKMHVNKTSATARSTRNGLGWALRAVHTMPLHCSNSSLRHFEQCRTVEPLWTTHLPRPAYRPLACLRALHRHSASDAHAVSWRELSGLMPSSEQ